MSDLEFTPEEMTNILEIAWYALANSDIFDEVSDRLDLSIAEMKSLQNKINEATK